MTKRNSTNTSANNTPAKTADKVIKPDAVIETKPETVEPKPETKPEVLVENKAPELPPIPGGEVKVENTIVLGDQHIIAKTEAETFLDSLPGKSGKSVARLSAESTAEAIKKLMDQQANRDFIQQLFAKNMKINVLANDHGEFVDIVNNKTGLSYTVTELREVDIDAPIDIYDKKELYDNVVDFFGQRIPHMNLNMSQDQQATMLKILTESKERYAELLKEGKSSDEILDIVSKELNAKADIMTGNIIKENKKTWLDPKYVAGAAALLSATGTVVINKDYSIGAIAGGVVGAGVSYYAADMLFSKVDMLKARGQYETATLSALLGAGIGIGGVYAGSFIEKQFFADVDSTYADVSTQLESLSDNVQLAAISAIDAEEVLNAYL